MERANHSIGNRNPMKMDGMFEGDINGLNPHLMTSKEMKKVKIEYLYF
jgi:hypothetical protein